MSDNEYICTMDKLGKTVPPKRVLLQNISLSFIYGAKIGVLGLNGAGKSTLLKIMAGVDKSYNGEIHTRTGLKIGYLPQEPQLDPNKDVRGNVILGVAELHQMLQDFDAISDRFAEPMSDEAMQILLQQQGDLQNAIDAMDGWNLQRRLDMAADALRLPAWDANIQHLSGGERRRVALCQLLLSDPDLLLLDEPTNHLDAESVAWLEHFLHDFKGTVVAVTHDRYFLDNVAGWILELDRGQGIPFQGNYSSWLEQKEKRLEIEEKQETARQKTIKTELEWIRSNPKGRHAKSKARVAQFEELNSSKYQKRCETQEIYIPPGPRLGDLVIEVNGISKGFEDRVLIENLSFQIPKGAIVGVIGPNGAGKTTLFRMLTGEQTPDQGNIRIGETVKFAYVDQFRDKLDGDKTVWEQLSDGQDIITIGTYQFPSRAYVGRFNFKGSDQQKRIKELSGGERNRLHLAHLLKAGGNVLILDEPTNDLDLETLRALEEALLNFPGCVIVSSHDRWFLDRLATHILAFEGDSHVEWFAGNYADYEQDRLSRLGKEATQPHRIKFKKLVAS
jgi:energy-dependent translational throttle protein EttA